MTEEVVDQVLADQVAQATEQVPTADANAGDTATPDDKQDESADSAAEARKHKGGFQKRIDELTRQREEERREKERLFSLLEKQLEKGESKKADAPAANAEPKRDDYESYEDYIEARAEWKAERKAEERIEARLRERDERQEKERKEHAEAEAAKAWDERLTSTRSKYADFDDVVTQDVPVSTTVARAIHQSETGPEIMYVLGKNPAEATRISRLPAAQQLIELGQLLAKNAPASGTAPTTKVPDPVRSPKTGSGTVDPLSTKLDVDTWRKNFEKQFYGNRR